MNTPIFAEGSISAVAPVLAGIGPPRHLFAAGVFLDRWTLILDLALVGALFVFLLRQIRGRRAQRVTIGLLLLVSAYHLAGQFQLEYLRTALGLLTPVAGVAIVVVFQSEIRRALMDLGGAFVRRADEQKLGWYEDVVMAVSFFSQNKTGALIVMERQTGLRTHIESGVPLDARLSYDLLVTIFHGDSSLHDGAAIVQKDRIAAAACFLPLSVGPDRTRELGSRHRAALGITEDTDAVAVVVAEKSGVISLAEEGKLVTLTGPAQLRERLSELFAKRVKIPGRSSSPQTPATHPAVDPPAEGPGVRVMPTPISPRENKHQV